MSVKHQIYAIFQVYRCGLFYCCMKPK